MVKRTSERGMTLIEIMIALLVSIVGIFGSLALLTTVLKSGDYSRRVTEASVLVQHKLEEQVGTPVTVNPLSPADNAGCPVWNPGTSAIVLTSTESSIDALGRTASAGFLYSRTCNYTTVADPAGTRRRLTVSVTWNDSLGKTRTMTMSRDRF